MTTQTERPNRKHWWQAAGVGVAALAFFRALAGCAPTLDRGIDDPSVRVSRYLDALIDDDHEVGLQYLVVNDTAVLYEYVGGTKDAKTGRPVSATTTFLTSSSTKTLTAAAVLRLVERGKVDLDHSLSEYVPAQPYGREITVRHLLNQSSGIPNPMPARWVHTREKHTSFDEERALEGVLEANAELDFDPGEKYAYSNISYWLLGRVIEQASGVSYCTFMRTEVLEPLAISPAELDCGVSDWSQHARGHQRRWSMLGLLLPLLTDGEVWDDDAGQWARFRHLHMNGPAYGGLVGSARGYSKFLQDMLRPRSRLLGESAKRLFFSEQRDASGELMPTTLGWHRGKLGDGSYYSKPGGGPGFSSNIRVYPDRGLATVWLSNRMRVSEREIQQFSDTLDGEFVGSSAGARRSKR